MEAERALVEANRKLIEIFEAKIKAKLDGSILFATLEPCAPDSRHAPKMSCTERIVLSRIKEVWVGIEDPAQGGPQGDQIPSGRRRHGTYV